MTTGTQGNGGREAPVKNRSIFNRKVICPDERQILSSYVPMIYYLRDENATIVAQVFLKSTKSV
ncbi:uncharacterized protein N7469_006542 [Penicillium citrinum]|uniref:Uncharacterized protein n=1 Tax=Penicillium citrinum TaxID=5077 RepID=A0A9W9TP66_PENCI|nr:uncharacterized protein N7469_006542 [Penicillium citrinum]KAJ5231954.1 hypothetical protein N7469_006542 [Penicillium citrinum]